MRAIVRWVLFVAAVLVTARLLAGQFTQLQWQEVVWRPGWLAAAAVAAIAYMFLYARLWRGLAEGAGMQMHPRQADGIFFSALAAKYLPGRLAGVGLRVSEYHRLGGWPVGAIIAVMYRETSLVVFSGATLVAVCTPWRDLRELGVHWAAIWWSLAAAAVAWLSPLLLPGLARYRPQWNWVAHAAGAATLVVNPGPVLRYGAAWMLLGTSLWLLLGAVGVPLTPANWALSVWAYTVAGLAGMFALFAPAGLGVREGVLALALTTSLTAPLAALAAVAARCLLLMAELSCAALGWWWLHRTDEG